MSNSSSCLGLGTAAIGRPQYINIRRSKAAEFSPEAFRQKGMRILEEAYQQGIRYFDTAPGYGMAEQLLIEWISDKNDPRIEIATKWGYTYVANFDPDAKVHEVKEHSLNKLNEQWLQSQHLFPYLTTYQIHSATFETAVLENTDILKRLLELKTKHGLLMGITTTGAKQAAVLEKALALEINGNALFDLFQVTYNLFDQSLASIAQEVNQQGKRLVIKEALANGRVFPNEKYPHYAKSYEKLEALADKYDVGLDAIALRFCVDSIAPFKVLSGAANKAHLLSNLKVNDFELSKIDIEALKEFAIPPPAYWQERKKLAWN